MMHAATLYSVYDACCNTVFSVWCMLQHCIQCMVHAATLYSVYGACCNTVFSVWCILYSLNNKVITVQFDLVAMSYIYTAYVPLEK